MKTITKSFLLSHGTGFTYDGAALSRQDADYCIEDCDTVYMWRTSEGDVVGGVKSGTHTVMASLHALAWDAVKCDDDRITMPDTFCRYSAAM